MENLEVIKIMYQAAATVDFPAFLGEVFGRIAADWEYWTLSDLEYDECTGNKIIVRQVQRKT
jgi:hypothetical protein